MKEDRMQVRSFDFILPPFAFIPFLPSFFHRAH